MDAIASPARDIQSLDRRRVGVRRRSADYPARLEFAAPKHRRTRSVLMITLPSANLSDALVARQLRAGVTVLTVGQSHFAIFSWKRV
jgi:hypothetical protein